MLQKKKKKIEIQDKVKVRHLKRFALNCHNSLETRTNRLLFNWPATGRSEGSGNVTELNFESRTRTPIRCLLLFLLPTWPVKNDPIL